MSEETPPVDDYAILKTMRTYGSSFARALSDAGLRADKENLQTLKTAFSDLWQQHAKLAASIKKNNPKED